MKIELNRYSRISLVQQIYENLSDRIRSGILNEEECLPSIREMSKNLEVSFLTVVKAYDLLEQNNLVKRVQGKGTFVKSHSIKCEKSKNTGSSYKWQLSVQDYLPRTHFDTHYNSSDHSLQFSLAAIAPSLLPNRYLENEIHIMLEKNPLILSEYGPIQGDLDLRIAMKRTLKKQKINVSEKDILVTNGTQQGIDLVARTFIGPGDVVIAEAPTYPAALDIFRSRGASILPVPIDKNGIRTDILIKLCETKNPKLIYTIPNFHNPTGIVLSDDRREQLLTIAQEFKIIIIEDDPWSEIYYNEKPPNPIKSLDTKGNVIYLKGLSKTLIPGCRIGLLTADGTIFNRLVSSKMNADLGSPLLTQKALYPLFQSKRMEDHIKKLRTALKIRRDLVIKLLKKHMPEGVEWIEPKGGLNIWISIPEKWDTKQLLLECQKKNLSFLPGFVCFSGEPETNHLRLSFSYLNDNVLETGIIELCRILKEFLSVTPPENSRLIL
ncbi:PLP-dependent aminotransferase family protein [Bacillus siamensis]|uniref:MocR-like pyridoxine biosynthesis transcription factor PdxR n=1 Tax=Bacillus siamensis TaxID=659243 RepID=UPI0005F94E4F|nr:PLP-dependent aminotransferase family protein [Bacillus siamensis]PIK29849.1 PLP-dependent aminotransferase family protein [Bacillus siamensis]